MYSHAKFWRSLFVSVLVLNVYKQLFLHFLVLHGLASGPQGIQWNMVMQYS